MRRIACLLIGLTLLSGCAAEIDAQSPVHVMVVNDDGITSPGLAALASVLAADPAYRVTVVAPAEQQSGVGHGLTIRREVAIRPHEDVGGVQAWSVDATPASVTGVGLTAILDEDLPALVVSGINKGENIGRASWYSGTIGGAREAVLRGVPAIAFSLELDWSDPAPDWRTAARYAKPVVDGVIRQPLPAGVLLNVNFPIEIASARGYRICKLGLAPDAESRYEVVREADGVRYVESRWAPPTAGAPGTDVAAIADGWVTITPLALDQTAYPVLANLIPLDLEPPSTTTD